MAKYMKYIATGMEKAKPNISVSMEIKQLYSWKENNNQKQYAQLQLMMQYDTARKYCLLASTAEDD